MKRRLLIVAISLLAELLIGPGHSYGQCSYDLSIVAAPACDGLGSPTLGWGINEAGQVAGQYTVCGLGATEAFLWDGGPDLITLERPPGVECAAAFAISNTGLIAGAMCVTDEGGDRAFLHDGAGFIDLGVPPGAIQSFGRGLNNQGDVVGKWGTGIQAFLYRDGVMIDLMPDLGAPSGDARDVNDAGQVVGWKGSSFSNARAYIWQDGAVTDLGVIPGGFTAQAKAINTTGHVVGSGRVRTNRPPFFDTHAFFWNGSEMFNLGTLPGFDLGAASDINELGQIVGTASGVGGNPNVEAGFIWQNGTMTNLNDLIPPNTGVEIKSATAINNQGQITGRAVADDGSGNVFAVLLTPLEQPVGDLDGDCQVGIIDFLTLLALWGPCAAPCPPSCAGDLDGDCNVGIVDFLLLLANWG